MGDSWGFLIMGQGIARTQSPLRKNDALESPTFGVIAGVNLSGVQWKGLVLGGPPCWSGCLPCQVSMISHGETRNPPVRPTVRKRFPISLVRSKWLSWDFLQTCNMHLCGNFSFQLTKCPIGYQYLACKHLRRGHMWSLTTAMNGRQLVQGRLIVA